MTDTLPLFPDPVQPSWTPKPGRLTCGRDPEAGPGSCWHWWEGCPRAEQRGCHVLWLKRQGEAA